MPPAGLSMFRATTASMAANTCTPDIYMHIQSYSAFAAITLTTMDIAKHMPKAMSHLCAVSRLESSSICSRPLHFVFPCLYQAVAHVTTGIKGRRRSTANPNARFMCIRSMLLLF